MMCAGRRYVGKVLRSGLCDLWSGRSSQVNNPVSAQQAQASQPEYRGGNSKISHFKNPALVARAGLPESVNETLTGEFPPAADAPLYNERRAQSATRNPYEVWLEALDRAQDALKRCELKLAARESEQGPLEAVSAQRSRRQRPGLLRAADSWKCCYLVAFMS